MAEFAHRGHYPTDPRVGKKRPFFLRQSSVQKKGYGSSNAWRTVHGTKNYRGVSERLTRNKAEKSDNNGTDTRISGQASVQLESCKGSTLMPHIYSVLVRTRLGPRNTEPKGFVRLLRHNKRQNRNKLALACANVPGVESCLPSTALIMPTDVHNSRSCHPPGSRHTLVTDFRQANLFKRRIPKQDNAKILPIYSVEARKLRSYLASRNVDYRGVMGPWRGSGVQKECKVNSVTEHSCPFSDKIDE